MGFVRGLIVVVVSVLLFLSLLSMTFFGVVNSSLKYENVEQKSADVIRDVLESGFNLSKSVDNVYPLMQIYCRNNSDYEYVYYSEGFTFSIPCSTVMQGKDAVINETIRDLVRNNYYAEYDCTLFECLKESPLFLISEKTYNDTNNNFYFFLFSSFLLFIALFIFIEKRTNTFLITGSILLICSLIFIKIDAIFSSFSGIVFQILGIFFSNSFSISINILIAGVIFLAIGLILKIFKLGFKIEEFISKFKKSSEDFKKKQNVKILPQPKFPSKKSAKSKRTKSK
ncbi:MAG: hypothetical protein M1416_02900 [Candidatus Pacearchaeota archaeon]|nr:hypothetical protein [Candidatus Pacearchaeota archaeon]